MIITHFITLIKTTVFILRITDQHFSSSYNNRRNLHVFEVPLPVWRPSMGIADFFVSKQQSKIYKTGELLHWFRVRSKVCSMDRQDGLLASQLDKRLYCTK